MLFRIKKGLDLPISGEPEQHEHASPAIQSVGLLGADYVNLKPRVLVDVGEQVCLGQAVIADRHDPQLQITAPGCGTIRAINRGPRRCLESLVIQLQGNEEETFDCWPRNQLDKLSAVTVRDLLRLSGQWTALRTRPFGHIADPRIVPSAIFVTAIDSDPLAPNPKVIIDARQQDFIDGIRLLTKLTPGMINVCTGPGIKIPVPLDPQTRTVAFEGPHPAGLVGTHIHFLEPVDQHRCVWYLGYQDVIAIGRLFTTGRLWVERVVSIAGSPFSRPRLIRTRLGACIADLTRHELKYSQCRLISGSWLGGRAASAAVGYLGRYHNQVCALANPRPSRFLEWLRPRRRKLEWSTGQHGRTMAMLPIGSFERVMPLDILPTPLLKALLIRDLDTAVKLGCLELEEEDLALCSHVCCSKQDYGVALRDCLDRLRKEL